MGLNLQETLISDALFGLAEPLPGVGLDDESLIKAAEETFGDRAFCIVKGWLVLDVVFDGEANVAAPFSCEPSVLFIHKIVFDSPDSSETAGYVTDYGRYDGCFFETSHKTYVLAGRGARKQVGKPTIEALQACSRA